MIGFVGCGKNARALVSAIVSGSKIAPKEIVAFDSRRKAMEQTHSESGVSLAKSLEGVVQLCEAVFVSLKQEELFDTLAELREFASKEKLFIIIAPQASLQKLEQELPEARVIKAAANLACLAGKGLVCYSAGSKASASDKQFAEAIFSQAGSVLELDESKMPAISAISSTGVGFVAHFFDAFMQAAMEAGLAEQEAKDVAVQTLLGASELLGSDLSASEIVSMMAVPKSAGDAGLRELDGSKFSEVVKAAVEAAVQKSKEGMQHEP